jgi:hypothetical protein
MYAECRILTVVMSNVIMLNVVLLSVIKLNVAMLSVIMLSVVWPNLPFASGFTWVDSSLAHKY